MMIVENYTLASSTSHATPYYVIRGGLLVLCLWWCPAYTGMKRQAFVRRKTS